jgi:hypothetical protein
VTSLFEVFKIDAFLVVEFMFRYLAAFWGVLGVSAILIFAIYRIFNAMLPALEMDFTIVHWLALLANIIFMAYSEGYKGFQKNFSPRVAARVLYLSKEASWVNGIFAPLFCMGYFGTTLRRQITSITVTIMLVALVVTVRQLPQPWRAIVDAGVTIGLLWGVISFLIYIWVAFRQGHLAHSPELPTEYPSKQE